MKMNKKVAFSGLVGILGVSVAVLALSGKVNMGMLPDMSKVAALPTFGQHQATTMLQLPNKTNDVNLLIAETLAHHVFLNVKHQPLSLNAENMVRHNDIKQNIEIDVKATPSVTKINIPMLLTNEDKTAHHLLVPDIVLQTLNNEQQRILFVQGISAELQKLLVEYERGAEPVKDGKVEKLNEKVERKTRELFNSLNKWVQDDPQSNFTFNDWQNINGNVSFTIAMQTSQMPTRYAKVILTMPNANKLNIQFEVQSKPFGT